MNLRNISNMFKYKKIRDVKSPERANHNDSGIDFYIPNGLWFITKISWWKKIKEEYFNISPFEEWYLIKAWERVLIPLWIKMELPEWYDLTFVNKSWIATNTWLIVWACLIDNWYRGELIVNLINTSNENVVIREWQKIIQWVIRNVALFEPIEEDIEEDTERWEGWFWSSGI